MATKATQKFLDENKFTEVSNSSIVLLADDEHRLVAGTDIGARILLTEDKKTIYVLIPKARTASEMDDFTPEGLSTNVKCKLNLKSGKFSLSINETELKIQSVGINALRTDMLAVADAIWAKANEPKGSC